MNHITPDGLVAVDQCRPPIRYRDHEMIVQDACLPEPRLNLILNPLPDDPAGQEYAHVELDVARAHALMTALKTFLQDAAGTSAWMYDGVKYNLESPWQARPGTRWEGRWFRYTDKFRLGVPVMVEIAPPAATVQFVLLPDLLGLKPCPVHNTVWCVPCHECTLDNTRALYAAGDTDPMRGE